MDGQRVLLTGASSGIGRELALLLARRGARLALAARRAGALEAVAEQACGAVVLRCDLAEPGAASELAARAQEALGGIDVLINNAGGGAGGQMWRVGDSEPAREAFEVNYWSPLALIAAVVPRMSERGSGTIVNV